MRNYRSDQMGRRGERKFDQLCEDADLIVSRLDPDLTGRDRHVEFPFEEPKGPLTYDTRPPPIACYVQIKTIRAVNARIKMRLSAAARLAGETKPAFACILRMDNHGEFLDAYLLHFYGDVLGAILKRLRHEQSKGSMHLNRLWISFAIHAAEKIPLTPEGLRDGLRSVVGDGMHPYAARKHNQLKELGFDEKRIGLNIEFRGVTMDHLIDGFLGLRDLPASTFETSERRFGIDLPIERHAAGEGSSHTLKVTPTPVDKCKFSVLHRDSGEGASLEGDLYSPGIPGLQSSYFKLLIKTRLLTITIDNNGINLKTTDEFSTGRRHELRTWLDTLKVMALLSEGGATASVETQKLNYSFHSASLSPLGDEDGWIRRSIVLAHAVLGFLEIGNLPDEYVSLDDLIQHEHSLLTAARLMMGQDGSDEALHFETDVQDTVVPEEVSAIYLSAVKIDQSLYAYALRATMIVQRVGDKLQWDSRTMAPLLVEKLAGDNPLDGYKKFRAKLVRLTGIENVLESELIQNSSSS
jgi:hypothetical protein